MSHKYLGSVSFAFKNTLTTTLNHKTCINTSGQVLVFKTLSRSLYTGFMIKGGGQCVKITDPKYLCYVIPVSLYIIQRCTLDITNCGLLHCQTSESLPRRDFT